MKKRILVIGGGLGGLSAACRLAARGHDVDVFEKRGRPGGCADVQHINGFTFDTGPAAIAAPALLRAVFQDAGRHMEDYFQLQPLEPFCRLLDPSGRALDFGAAQPSIGWAPAEEENVERFLQACRARFEKHFLGASLGPASLLESLRGLRDESLHAFAARFFRDDLLRKAFCLPALALGGNPYEAPASLASLHALAGREGVWRAAGGMGMVVSGLVKLLGELGGRLHLHAGVTELLGAGRRISGARLQDGRVQRADIVISAVDPLYTFRILLGGRSLLWNGGLRWARALTGSSLLVICLGVRRLPGMQGLAEHNVLLGPRFQEQMEALFHHKALPEDLSLYLHAPAPGGPPLAPEGCQVLRVMTPVPGLDSGIDWSKTARPLRERVLRRLEETCFPGLRAAVLAEHHLSPRHFQEALHWTHGAPFSLQPTRLQSGWFRPHNRCEDFDNLYLVGAGTHPGAGLPGVLASASIVERLIQAQE